MSCPPPRKLTLPTLTINISTRILHIDLHLVRIQYPQGAAVFCGWCGPLKGNRVLAYVIGASKEGPPGGGTLTGVLRIRPHNNDNDNKNEQCEKNRGPLRQGHYFLGPHSQRELCPGSCTYEVLSVQGEGKLSTELPPCFCSVPAARNRFRKFGNTAGYGAFSRRKKKEETTVIP